MNCCSNPTDLRITDLRCVDIDGAPKRCTIIRIDTNQGVCGYGEVRDGGNAFYVKMLKRVLIGEIRNARNKAAKSELKTAIKKFEVAAAEGNRTEADGAYKVAVKKVDQAVAKGIMHKNTAAHRKSAMTLKLNKMA